MRTSFSLCLSAGLLLSAFCHGQSSPGFDPHALFAPDFYGGLHPGTRSPNGAPSTSYWQNRADYQLSVVLDTVLDNIRGTDIIHYTNNSPDSLSSLWIYLEQQTYRPDARSNFYTGFAPDKHTQGFQLESVKIGQAGGLIDADTV